MSIDAKTAKAYWRANLKLVAILLAVWAVISFGAGIVFLEELNAFALFGFPLGFWIAQQGSIFCFVVLIFVYARKISRIEQQLGLSDKNEPDSYDLTDGESSQ